MTIFKKTIELDGYIDDSGNPCCAKNIETGEVCLFYRTSKFGCRELCGFCSSEPLSRRKDGYGTLIPHKDCPIHKNES